MGGRSHLQTQHVPMEHTTYYYHQMGGNFTTLQLGQYSPKSQHVLTQQVYGQQTQGKTPSPI